METFLERLARKDKERKEKKKKIEDKYWKLSSQERMEYDSKRSRIEKYWNYTFPILLIRTICLFSIIMFGLLVIYLLSDNHNLIHLLSLSLILVSFKLFMVILLMAIFIDILFMYYCLIKKDKEIKEINKRFKL